MSLLAFAALVPFFTQFTHRSSLLYPFRRCHGSPPKVTKKLSISGVNYWLQSCRSHELSREVGIWGLKGVSRKTLVSYQKCWTTFSNWYNKWACDYSGVTVDKISRFLLFLFSSKTSQGKEYSVDALNTHRSALSFFLKLEFPNLGYDNTITRLF